MKENEIDQIINEALSELKLDEICIPTGKARSLTLWVPEESKNRFDELQAKSRGRFGKVLKSVLVRTIDKVKAS